MDYVANSCVVQGTETCRKSIRHKQAMQGDEKMMPTERESSSNPEDRAKHAHASLEHFYAT